MTRSPTRSLLAALLLAACTPGQIDDHGAASNQLPRDVEDALIAMPRAEVMSVGLDGLPTFIRGELAWADSNLLGLPATELESALSPAMIDIAPAFHVGS